MHYNVKCLQAAIFLHVHKVSYAYIQYVIYAMYKNKHTLSVLVMYYNLYEARKEYMDVLTENYKYNSLLQMECVFKGMSGEVFL